MTLAEWDVAKVGNKRIIGNNLPVQLKVYGENCEGLTFSFRVRETNGIFGSNDVSLQPADSVMTNGLAVSTWKTEWQRDFLGDPEFKFIAKTNPEIESGELIVEEDMSYCQEIPITFCSDYNVTNFGSEAQSYCEADLDTCNIIENSIPEGIDCETPGIDCGCTWRWQTGECAASYTSTDVGTCFIQEEGDSATCEEGDSLTYAWTAFWEWSSGNFLSQDPESNDYWENSSAIPTVWHYDPINLFKGTNKSGQCISGSETIPCPAQIQLPFFNVYNLIVTLIVIILIYILINSISKKKKPVRKKRKKK